MSAKVYFVSDNPAERFEVPDIQIGSTPDLIYPDVWFNDIENTGSKPFLRLDKLEGTLMELRANVYKDIIEHTLKIEMVNRYLWEVMKTQKTRLNEDWVSFGRQIGKKGEQVTVEDLLSLCETQSVIRVEEVAGSTVKAKDDAWMLIYLTAGYRFANVKRADYQESLIRKVEVQLRFSRAPPTITGRHVHTFARSLSQDKWNRVLLAAIDMYMVRFPHHPYASVKVGTVGTRFKDCGALLDLKYLCELTGKTPPQLSEWIWNRNLAKDFSRITKSGQEIDNEHSYTPYMIELGISSRSPYSSIANVNFHFWVHAIGCTLSKERSLNARFIGVTNFIPLVYQAAVYAYALLKFSADQDADMEKETAGDGEEVVIEKKKKKAVKFPDEPLELNPNDWLALHQKCGNELSPAISKKLNTIWGSFTNARAGTIANYLHKWKLSV